MRWVRVLAPLIPEVAFVELPPQKDDLQPRSQLSTLLPVVQQRSHNTSKRCSEKFPKHFPIAPSGMGMVRERFVFESV